MASFIESWGDALSEAANDFWRSIGDFLPKILGAIVLIIIGAFVAKLASSLIERLLKLLRFDKLTTNTRVTKTLKTVGVDWNWIDILSRTVFWVVIIIFGMTIADVLELNAMRDTIRELLDYVPNVFAAAIVLTLTVAGARLVKTFVTTSLIRFKIDFAATVGNITQWAIIVFGAVMAADQLGFDTTLLVTNLTVIVAGAVLAFALAFGLGGRDIAHDWLARNFKPSPRPKPPTDRNHGRS